MNMINTKDSQQSQMNKNLNNDKPLVNESSGIYIRGFVKIIDPESGDVLLHTAD